MTSKVYFGSAHQSRLDAKETLPAKLDLILEELALRDRVKNEIVALKMHLGSNIGYSVIHPVFVRKVVQAVKEGGGRPFVVDIAWDAQSATERGYTPEVLGCPVIASAGLKDHYHYVHEYTYKNLNEWKIGGMIEDATFLVNFAHIKGHPSCGFGGAIKNLALGNMVQDTRRAMHDVCHFDPYFFPEHMTDEVTLEEIIQSCPHDALVKDKEHPNRLHLHVDNCNQCGRCLKVAPEGSLKIDPANFHSFQKACAISTMLSLGTFETGKAVHLSLAEHMTPVCDCFGFTGMPILPDVGIFGSNDIVAVEQAALDKIAEENLILENLPREMEAHYKEGHPFAQLHGPLKDPYLVVEYCEALGLGSRDYELVDVLPVEDVFGAKLQYINTKTP